MLDRVHGQHGDDNDPVREDDQALAYSRRREPSKATLRDVPSLRVRDFSADGECGVVSLGYVTRRHGRIRVGVTLNLSSTKTSQVSKLRRIIALILVNHIPQPSIGYSGEVSNHAHADRHTYQNPVDLGYV